MDLLIAHVPKVCVGIIKPQVLYGGTKNGHRHFGIQNQTTELHTGHAAPSPRLKELGLKPLVALHSPYLARLGFDHWTKTPDLNSKQCQTTKCQASPVVAPFASDFLICKGCSGGCTHSSKTAYFSRFSKLPLRSERDCTFKRRLQPGTAEPCTSPECGMELC